MGHESGRSEEHAKTSAGSARQIFVNALADPLQHRRAPADLIRERSDARSLKRRKTRLSSLSGLFDDPISVLCASVAAAAVGASKTGQFLNE
jgi:hypothetical protein